MADLLPDTPKVQFWLSELRRLSTATSTSQLEVQSLVGRLSFAVSAAYGPSCRGRLRPLFDWANRGGGLRCSAVNSALAWWTSRLARPAPRRLRLTDHELPPALLYTDAEGNGGLGAVLIDGTASSSSSWTCPTSVTKALPVRKTQINPLEMIAVWVALRSYRSVLEGRNVVIFVDNLVAMHVLKKGTSRKPDLNKIAMAVWSILAESNITPSFAWVPSALNSADGPSRGVLRPDHSEHDVNWKPLLASISSI